MKSRGAYFCQTAIGTRKTTAAAAIETAMYIIWRYRKYSFLSPR